MIRTKKTFTPEFKLQMVQLFGNGKSKSDIVRDKEPEESTLEKIKSYLKNQTNIYSIVNIRSPLNSTTC